MSRRRVRFRLLLPEPQGRGVLTSGCDIPSIEVEIESDVETIGGAPAALRTVGLGPPVLDCLVDQRPDEIIEGARQALIQLPPPSPDWRPPPSWSWSTWGDVRPELPPVLDDACTKLLGELQDGRPADPLRVSWAEPDWYTRASSWIVNALVAAGRAAPDSIAQHRHWGISAVMRVDASDGRTWFKASFPPFRHEPAVTHILDELTDGSTPRVIAIDVDEAWLLTDDLGTTSVSSAIDSQAAIDRLVALQKSATPAVDPFLLAGCERRLPRDLATSFMVAMQRDVTRSIVQIEHGRLLDLAAAVETEARAIDSFGFPETVAHGDFHPGNVAPTVDGPVIFDWSDACVTTPIVDLATWMWWYAADDPRRDEIWRWFTSAWQRGFDVDVTGLARRSVDVVGAAFHVISYVNIAEHLETHRLNESEEGITHFLEELERHVDVSGSRAAG